MNAWTCAHACKCVWEMCVCVYEGERKTSRRPSSSVVSQVLTVYICVNILSPVHVRATVNKQKPVLLIKALAAVASSFTSFPLLMDNRGCVRMYLWSS